MHGSKSGLFNVLKVLYADYSKRTLKKSPLKWQSLYINVFFTRPRQRNKLHFIVAYENEELVFIGQARSFFHLRVLESVCIKTQNPVLCKQKEFIFSLGLFK